MGVYIKGMEMIYPTHVGMNRRYVMKKAFHAAIYPTHVGMNRLSNCAAP